MLRWINRAIVALLVLVVLPFWWLMIDNRPGNPQPFPISITTLRSLAASMPGPAPTAIGAELAGWRFAPRDVLVAGSGLKPRLIGIIAYRLEVPGHAPILIDSGTTPAGAAKLGLENYDAPGQAHINRWLGEAALVLFTHEHFDHIGGFVAQLSGPGGGALLAKARLNPGQLPPSPIAATLDWPRGLPLPAPAIHLGAPQAVAPGVVVIPAPSHTPGSQMIYVRLANGREYLFAGDISSMAANWQELRGRSRLFSQYLAGPPEDRAAVFAWLATIRQWHREAPGMVVLGGHDWRTIAGAPGHLGIMADFSDTPPSRN
ncbi:MAG: MBL fold metallo-hydrolase [Proteobacteria bacterium]|nr:MBL fold metallo-hydrolase [Pseudomonadota bacterium]